LANRPVRVENRFVERHEVQSAKGAAQPDRGMRWLWWVIGGCGLVVIAAPNVIRARPAPVEALALWGGAGAVASGISAAIVKIIWTKGRPLGERDPVLDYTSPYLRLSQRYGLVLAGVLVAGAVGGLAFDVYWYPRPDPFQRGLTAEEYVLGPTVLALFLLGLGAYLLVVQAYWARVVRRGRRASQSS
ncbi:MAG TPA: hypothetical protein VJ259_03890, partial [Actinomycetota bacterium]|nr:hypothetical protein [Actinomycetota bacterium]